MKQVRRTINFDVCLNYVSFVLQYAPLHNINYMMSRNCNYTGTHYITQLCKAQCTRLGTICATKVFQKMRVSV